MTRITDMQHMAAPLQAAQLVDGLAVVCLYSKTVFLALVLPNLN